MARRINSKAKSKLIEQKMKKLNGKYVFIIYKDRADRGILKGREFFSEDFDPNLKISELLDSTELEDIVPIE